MADMNESRVRRGRRWPLVAVAAVCGLALVLFVVPGPLRGRVRRVPPVVVLPPVVSLERLSDEAAQKEMHREPPPPPAEDVPPPGLIPNEWEPLGITSGKHFHCVCTGGRPTRVWIYDAKWRVLGEVKPPKGFDPEGKRLAGAQCDPQGRWLAVHFRIRQGANRSLVIVVAPPNLQPRAQLRVPSADWDWMAWSGGRLLVGYPDRRGNVIRGLSPTDGQVSTVYSESVAGWNRIMWPELSPDGRYLAFTRGRLPDPNEHEDYTVWLLDLQAAVAMQLTGEREGNSMHSMVRWEGPRTLLFWRSDELYRATLDLPVTTPSAAGEAGSR